MSAFSPMLAAAAIAGWIVLSGARGAPRAYGRMACALFAALAAACAIDPRLAQSVTLIASAVAPALLAAAAFAAFRRPPRPATSSLALALATAAGIFASASGIAALAFAALVVAALTTIATALRAIRRSPVAAIQSIASFAALLAGAAAFLSQGRSAQSSLMMFYAAGVLGSALSLARGSAATIENQRPMSATPAAAIGDPGQ
jgi:hypothetical protein